MIYKSIRWLRAIAWAAPASNGSYPLCKMKQSKKFLFINSRTASITYGRIYGRRTLTKRSQHLALTVTVGSLSCHGQWQIFIRCEN